MTDKHLGFVFPGQGSQSTGMLAELTNEKAIVRQTFTEASERLGFDLWELIRDNPDNALDSTRNTQPALLAGSVAVWRAWKEMDGPDPAVVAGHSLGEYSALVCAGVVSLTDAVALVADRGKYMQEAVPEGIGAMAAILGLGDEQVIQVCNEAAGPDVVSAANFNSSGQVVIAGHKQAVERAINLAKEAGAKRAILLPVSVPSHCSLMRDAADRFAGRMDQVSFSDAAIPIIQNVDAQVRTDAAAIKQGLLQQLHQSVLWWQSVNQLKALGITRVIECGPGKVLSGLIKRIDRTVDTGQINDPASLDAALNRGET